MDTVSEKLTENVYVIHNFVKTKQLLILHEIMNYLLVVRKNLNAG